MLDQEEIDQQLQLLAIHRRTLAHALRQHKVLGVLAPAALTNGIHEAWTHIAQIKAALRASGVEIADELDDESRELTITVPTLSPTDRRNRSRILQKVHDFWVKGVLENSLHGAALIALGMEYKPEAVQYPWDILIQQPNQPTRTILPGTRIIDMFDELGGELLILGAPGSGKTTMLLELARDSISRAEQDESYPIPVVFNLSSWAEKRKPLVEWLVDELNTKYDVPRKIGKAWIEADQVLPLLDGLDEVNQQSRSACVDAINTFRKEQGLMSIVVCSRIADYDALTARLKLQGSVLIQPLTHQQIDTYLERAGEQLAGLRTALKHGEGLRELAKTPLMLAIMTLVYQEQQTDTLARAETAEEQWKQLFNVYIDAMFKRRSRELRYMRERTVQWLGWMASRMVQYSQAVFYIEQMQPGWLSGRSQRWSYVLTSRLIFGLIFGLSGGLIVGLIFPIVSFRPEDMLDLLIVGLIFGLSGGLGVGLFDALQFDLTRGFASYVMGGVLGGGLIVGLVGLFFGLYGGLIGLIFGLIGGLIFGMISGLFFWLRGGIKSTADEIKTVETLSLSWSGALKGAAVGLILSLILRACTGQIGVGVDFVLIGAMFGGISGRTVEKKTSPNQGIRLALRNAIITGLIGLSSGLLLLLMTVLTAAPTMDAGDLLIFVLILGLSVGLLIGVPAFMWYGGLDIIQHFTLRINLYRSGYIPWNYARFLDYGAERIFLRKVGGGYIFIHRSLMEYFAPLYPESPDTERRHER